jgi:hypothetical protein
LKIFGGERRGLFKVRMTIDFQAPINLPPPAMMTANALAFTPLPACDWINNDSHGFSMPGGRPLSLNGQGNGRSMPMPTGVNRFS